MGIEIGMEII